ncbi:MAG TPA: hypothetical protein VLV16_00530 [Gemmatimonadales bacterium]|nr:hypothetical protein [Gemmatimonadales bacterium]
MKRMLALFALVLVAAMVAHPARFAEAGSPPAAGGPYRVVFDLTSRDSLDQKAVVRWLTEISASNPDAKMEVVMYGKGFELVMPDRSTMLAEVRQAARNPNISFKVCQVALKNNRLERSQLIDEAQVVPDGIREIVTKQQQGWGYIKVGH